MNLYNLEAIKKFTGLNDETVDLLAKTFLEELEESNKEILELQQTGDNIAIRRAIHKMKPGFIMFGFSEITPLMTEILDMDMAQVDEQLASQKISSYLAFALELESDMKSKMQ